MDKETFLASGLLEQYVLEIIDPNEKKLVEQHLNQYPELRQEVAEMRKAIEQYAMQHAIPPPPGMKEKVLREISQVASPAANQGLNYGKASWLNVLVIGALAVLCGLTALSMRNLQQENQTLKVQLSTCDSREKIVDFLKDPQTRPVMLESTTSTPEVAALVYWNEQKQLGMINPFNLPKLPKNEQYQIWADIDGKMVSVGLISEKLEKYQALNYLPEASSLNITIEPLGGSTEPNVGRLVANHAI